MKFWLTGIAGYLVLLGAALATPWGILADRSPMSYGDLGLFLLMTVVMLMAVLVCTLLITRRFFPIYWWMAQVQGKDVYEYDGVYFVGIRINRVPNRLQRMVFGVDEKMRKWDLLFGLLFLALLIPHAMAGLTSFRVLDAVLPQRTEFYESLHKNTLSTLPLLKEWGTGWSFNGDLNARLKTEDARLRAIAPGQRDAKTNFRIAEVKLLSAFSRRTEVNQPFYHSPGDRYLFDRGDAAEAAAALNAILALPENQREGLTAPAKVLLGFFHLSDHNYRRALELFQKVLPLYNTANSGPFSRYQVLLLAAHAATLANQNETAQQLLEQILVDDRMPYLAYALALEQFAETLRQDGRTERVQELLSKSAELFRLSNDASGIARVHLRLALLALQEGRVDEARKELAQASSLAASLGDWFTINMIERVYQGFPG